jgi:hypothetical protein
MLIVSLLAVSAIGILAQTPPAASEKRLAPTEYLEHLKKELARTPAYTAGFDGPAVADVSADDLAALIKFLDSKEPCSATIKAGLAKLPKGSTIGHEAAVLLDSYRLDKKYPLGEASTEHGVDRKKLHAWYKERERGFDIRLVDGSVIISSDSIIAYDWDTHTMVLRGGLSDELRKTIHGKGARPMAPFNACIGGKIVYAGQFVSPLSSQSSDKVSIVFSLDPRTQNQVPIARGYAVDESKLVEPDPRGDERIKNSLRIAGKVR